MTQKNLKDIHDISGLIVGTLKIVSVTDEKDSSKCRIWEAQCICGKKEYGTKKFLEQHAGHVSCPGHPIKGKEQPLDGFKLTPELKDTLEQKKALEKWETARIGKKQPEADAPRPNKERPVKTTGSDILKVRLGLDGYHLETVTLPEPLTIQGLKVPKIIFAKSLAGEDRVLLHLDTISETGKRSIISSRKKLSDSEWTAICLVLEKMHLTWREKEPRKKAA
jgi:hypothetical protein